VLAAGREGVKGHPTPKPIKVWLWLVERVSAQPSDLIFEPFCGSGTTIMACEQLGRNCAAIEIAPEYVDVAIQRWQSFTGQQATLNGKTFEEVRAERAKAA
jgi:DNA modification methylase